MNSRIDAAEALLGALFLVVSVLSLAGIVLAECGALTLPVLASVAASAAEPPHPAAPREGRPRVEFLKAMEREELQTALASAGWVIARAAKILGWTPRQVAYKMKKHGLTSPWKK